MIKVSQEISVKGLLVYRFDATLIDNDNTRDQNVYELIALLGITHIHLVGNMYYF